MELKEIKTLECITEGIFFKIYKITFIDDGYIYLITRMIFRNYYNMYNNVKVKHIIGNIFRFSK